MARAWSWVVTGRRGRPASSVPPRWSTPYERPARRVQGQTGTHQPGPPPRSRVTGGRPEVASRRDAPENERRDGGGGKSSAGCGAVDFVGDRHLALAEVVEGEAGADAAAGGGADGAGRFGGSRGCTLSFRSLRISVLPHRTPEISTPLVDSGGRLAGDGRLIFTAESSAAGVGTFAGMPLPAGCPGFKGPFPRPVSMSCRGSINRGEAMASRGERPRGARDWGRAAVAGGDRDRARRVGPIFRPSRNLPRGRWRPSAPRQVRQPRRGCPECPEATPSSPSEPEPLSPSPSRGRRCRWRDRCRSTSPDHAAGPSPPPPNRAA